MPTAPLRLCLFPRCGVRVPGGYCAQHDRPSAAKRGYGRPWQRYRREWLSAHPFCGDRADGWSAEHSVCRAEGLETLATHVDHIDPVTGPDDPRFFDPADHQSLCETCHAQKTAREDGGFGNRARARVSTRTGTEPVELA